MDKDLLDCFSYAILQGDTKLFDLLAKDFDKFDQNDKTSLLEKTIIGAPNTSFIQHVLDYGYDINYKNEEDFYLPYFTAAFNSGIGICVGDGCPDLKLHLGR